MTIDHFTAATRNGGSVAINGNVRVAPDAGFPATLRISGHNAELVSNDFVTAIAELALDISGPLARRPRIGGKVTFDSIDVRVPDSIPASSRPLADTRHVKPSAAARARLALAAKNRVAKAKAAPAFNADLNIAVSAPSRIFVRGHGMDAELGGELTMTGDLSAPVAHGGFQIRRGAFTLAGKRLDFARGNITFAGGVIPQLDFAAQSTASDVTAQILISGPADQPQFAFTSVPELPQDEVFRGCCSPRPRAVSRRSSRCNWPRRWRNSVARGAPARWSACGARSASIRWTCKWAPTAVRALARAAIS